MINKLKIKLQDEQNGTYQGFVSDNNKKDIFGAFLWDSGDFYIGEWRDNKINGQGIIYFSSGGYLEGFFNDSVAQNQALLVFPNNDRYFANWKKGNLDGKVQMCFKVNKKLFTTIYEDGKFCKIDSIKGNIKEVKAINEFSEKCDISKLISKYQTSLINQINHNADNKKQIAIESQLTFSKINFQDGGFFIGITQNNIPNGLGLFYYQDQKFDCGIYQNGFLNGMGRKNFPNGDLYDGYFIQGKFEGEGIIYHKRQNEYSFGTFKENLILDQQQRGEDFPQDISNQIKKQHHMQGENYTDKIVSDQWIKLSLQHNIQFIGNTGKQETLIKQNQLQQQQQFVATAYSTSRTKDNTQKYHQKNLDTVYYLNQKIRAGQISTSNQPTYQEIVSSKEGTHRKNQTSLDFLKSGIDSGSNSLQKIKSENIPILQLNQNSFIQQQLLINYSNIKNGLKEHDEDKRQRKSKSNTRKQSTYLSPVTRNTTQYYSLLSPQPMTTKNKKITSSPSDRSTNQSGNINNKNQINKNLLLKLQKELSPPPSQMNLQSPLAKTQKTVSQKQNSFKNKASSQPNNPQNDQRINNQQNTNNIQPKISILNFKGSNIQLKIENIYPQADNQQSQRNKNLTQEKQMQQKINTKQQKETNIQYLGVDVLTNEDENNLSKENNIQFHDSEMQTPINHIKSEESRTSFKNQNNQYKQNILGKKQITSLIGQKSQKSLNRVASPDSIMNYQIKSKNNNIQQRTIITKSVEDAILKGVKTPINQVEDNSIDQNSYKEASADISRVKQDSQGDLLNENKNSQLKSKSSNKSKITQQVNKLKKQKSQEGQQFIQGYNSQLNNTPQREPNQNINQINYLNSRKTLPFQTEESMKHYYQTRIRKQIPEEISVREELFKNKQSAVLSTKSCSTNGANGNFTVSTQIQQKFTNSSSEINKLKKKKEIQQQQILKQNNKTNTLNTKYKNLISNERGLKFSKGLLSVKSQDNLVNEVGCSFSSLQEQQQTQNDDNQKSLFNKFDQYQSQSGLECFTLGDQVQTDEIDLKINQHFYEEDFIINNENKNCLNKPLRSSECSALNGLVKTENIYPESILLVKGFSVENDQQQQQIVNIESSNQGEEKSLKSTISDQIKHILSMQKNNNSKHKFSVQPFMIQMNNQKEKNNENYSSENQIYQTKGQSSKITMNQNQIANQNLFQIAQNNNNYYSEQDERQKEEQNNQTKSINNEILQAKAIGDRHILTPFHPPKNLSNSQKNSLSTNSFQKIKNQKVESIRSINQKMSSYISFQERLNAIGQCIYKKDWNATQSLNSIKSLSRNNSTLAEQNQVSEDNINQMNPLSSDNLPNKEEKTQLLKSNISQLVVDYLQAQNSVSLIGNNSENYKNPINASNQNDFDQDQIEKEIIISYDNSEQYENKDQLIKENLLQNNNLYQNDDTKISQIDQNYLQKLQDQNIQNVNSQCNLNNECILNINNPSYISIISEYQNQADQKQFNQQDIQKDMQGLINLKCQKEDIQSISQDQINPHQDNQISNINDQFNNKKDSLINKENTLNYKENLNQKKNQSFENILQIDEAMPDLDSKQSISQSIQRSDDQNLKILIEKNSLQIETVINQNEMNHSNQNVPFFSGVLKTEEGDTDSVNKNDLACLQLNGFNDSGLFDNNNNSDDLNELQIDQKHFNEDFLGINALDEIFSQNSGSLCSQSPSKQDYNNKKIIGKDKFQLNQFDIINNRQQINRVDEEDDDLEFQKIFDCQINLENLDIFDISSQPFDDNFNKNGIRLNQHINNQNTYNKNNNHIYRPNIIEDIGELSPIKIKENVLDDPFQQQQMITELHFYEDILLQQSKPKQIGGNKHLNTFEENGRQYQKYQPVLEIINENVSEDQYTSPKKKQRSSQHQILSNREDFDAIVSELQF